MGSSESTLFSNTGQPLLVAAALGKSMETLLGPTGAMKMVHKGLRGNSQLHAWISYCCPLVAHDNWMSDKSFIWRSFFLPLGEFSEDTWDIVTMIWGVTHYRFYSSSC